MAQQFVTSSSAAVGPRIQDIDQSGTMVQRPVAYWRQVSWGAIIAGSVLAISIQILLSLLGAGIGLVTLGATEADDGSGFGIAAGVWWLVASLISLFIGGLAAGRLARVSQATDGVFHGLLVWAVTTLFSIWLLTTAASNLIGGAFTGLTNYMASPNAPSVSQMMPGGAQTPDRSVGAQEPIGPGPGADTPTGQARVGGLEGQQNQVPELDEEDAREAASTAGQAALWSFFALTLGAVAAGWGGSVGRHIFSRWDESTTVVSRTTTPTHQQTPPPQQHYQGTSGSDTPNP